MVLTLRADQVTALEAIKRRRDTAALAQALAAAFPDVPGRLGERYGLLVEHGVRHAAQHGLQHLACVARYLACWFMLGAEFETRPGFEWAARLLQGGGRSQGAKAFQLCRRTREELARLAQQPAAPAPGPSVAEFDRAITALDAELQPKGTLASLLPPQPIPLGAACDVDAIDLRPADAAASAAVYRFEQGRWRLVPSAGHAAAPAFTLTAASDRASLPPQLHLLTGGPGHDRVRLRVRTRAAACCDPQLHPLVRHNGAQGIAEWRGLHAGDFGFDLPAAAATDPPADGLQPVIAAESVAPLSVLGVSSCGLRDSGEPLGDWSVRLASYRGEQQLVAWQREPGPALNWPGGEATPAAAPPRARVERDGAALDAGRWQAGLAALDRQLADGLGRLAGAWEREAGVTQVQVSAEPRVLCGSAGIAWGWVPAAQGLGQAPVMGVTGVLDLLACQLDLRLAGELRLHGSRSRLTLRCDAAQRLSVSFERGAAGGDLQAVLAGASFQVRQPFTLALEALATDESVLAQVTGPVSGALSFEGGVRQRPQGFGLQWFAKITLQPLAVPLELHDPLLGRRHLQHRLLPALTLLDWSLG